MQTEQRTPRVDFIIKNVKFAAVSQVLLMLANFFVRRIFLLTLGKEYLGLNSLFADILSLLSLAELGFGTSITYSLYKPVANGDREKIKSLMDLYRKAYLLVGALVLIVGSLLTPYLKYFVAEMPSGIPHIRLIYLMHVVNSGISYFFIYKASLLFADQKKYIEVLIGTVVKLCASVLQVVVLWRTRNYLLYMGILLGSTLLQNLWISYKTDSLYPFLREKEVRKLEQEELYTIRRNVTAMVFHKIGDVVIFGTDNLLMAKFVSVAAVGLYSNYVLILRALVNIGNMIFNSISSSMGNLNACETDDKKYVAFHHMHFFAAWLFGEMSICLFCLYNPFITIWLGKEYLLPGTTVLIIVINFYISCMRMPVGRTKDAMGLFWKDRYKAVVESIINLVLSIILVRNMGIAGVLWGTFFSSILVPVWIEPLVVYHYGLKKHVFFYFRQYLGYSAVTICGGVITWGLCRLLPEGVWGFAGKMVLCGMVPNLIYLLCYRKTEDFRYMTRIVLDRVQRKETEDGIKAD